MKKKILIAAVFIISILVIVYFAFPGVLYRIAVSMERNAAGLTEKSIQVGNYKIFYLEGGNGENILLVHGYGADKSNWVRFAKYLTPSYRVFAVDLPGFGESSRIKRETYSIAEQVKRLNNIADALAIKKFHIAGNSMGGSISTKYTMEYPERILSLTLFDSGGVTSCEKSKVYKMMKKGQNPFYIETTADFDTLMGYVFVKVPFIPRPIKNYLTEQSIKNREFTKKIGNDLFKEKLSLEPELNKITVPTLIIWGDADQLIHFSCAGVFNEKIANSSKIIMKDCGHCPMIERPEESANHFLAFLKGIGEKK